MVTTIQKSISFASMQRNYNHTWSIKHHFRFNFARILCKMAMTMAKAIIIFPLVKIKHWRMNIEGVMYSI